MDAYLRPQLSCMSVRHLPDDCRELMCMKTVIANCIHVIIYNIYIYIYIYIIYNIIYISLYIIYIYYI